MLNANLRPYPIVQMKKDKSDNMIEREKSSSWLVSIACLSFFPLIYLIGKTIVTWLG